MPPRFAYWTILIDQKPTAFRAAEKEELLPTFVQLQRKNPDVVMKWFARGRLWDNPEQAQWALANMDRTPFNRGRDWRPGGEHKDPRDRFKKRREARSQSAPSGFRKPPSTDRPEPKSGDRPTPSGYRPPPSGDRRPPSAQRPAPRGDSRPSPSGYRPPPSGDRRPPTGERPAPRGDSRPSPAAHRPPPKSGDRPTPSAQRPPSGDCRPPSRPWRPGPPSSDRPPPRKWPKKPRG